jgi:hypothetical protein
MKIIYLDERTPKPTFITMFIIISVYTIRGIDIPYVSTFTTCFRLMWPSSGTLDLTITHFISCYSPYTGQCLHIGSALYVWFYVMPCVSKRIEYCHVLSDYRRVLDCQLDLLDHKSVTQLGYSVLHFTIHNNWVSYNYNWLSQLNHKSCWVSPGPRTSCRPNWLSLAIN